MQPRAYAVIGVLAVTLALRPSAAQAPAHPDSATFAALARLGPGKRVRLHSRDLGRLEGRVVASSPATLTLNAGDQPTEVPVATVDSLWVRGTAAKAGAIVGAIPGAVAGVLMGVIANDLGCKDDGGDPCPEAIPLLAALGAAGGGLLGALVGAAIPRWRRLP